MNPINLSDIMYPLTESVKLTMDRGGSEIKMSTVKLEYFYLHFCENKISAISKTYQVMAVTLIGTFRTL